MNPRERTLLGVFLSLLIVGGSVALFYFGFFQSYLEMREQTALEERKGKEKQDELDKLQKEMDLVLNRSPRLKGFSKISLPDLQQKPGGARTRNQEDVIAHQKRWQQSYGDYLRELLHKSGFMMSSISVSPKLPDTKTPDAKGGALSKDKVPVYTRLPFTVSGNATTKNIVDMLYAFHSDPLLHEIRSLSITKPQTPRPGAPDKALDVTMTVEVLMVTGAEWRPYDTKERKNLIPKDVKKEPVLAQGELGERIYGELVARDPFWGTKGGVSISDPGPKTMHESPEVVLKFVKLTMIAYDRHWKATFYNQGTGGTETPVSLLLTPKLVVTDIYNQQTFVATVVYLDAKELILFDKETDHYYLMHVGDVVSTALSKPLKTAELEKYGLGKKKVAAANPE
jgi:hypothetical protein